MLTDNAPTTSAPGNMPGFDSEFTDIVDYILRITLRIWEGKQVGLCQRYYSDDCPVWTLAGYTEGAEQVTRNTLLTLGAFPDRTLHADNIVWSGNPTEGFHSSHLISSHMTHCGETEHGPATGKSATIQVIAHCVVRENRIVEEWLVRDNWSLAEQLGCDPWQLAKQQASTPLDSDGIFATWLQQEWQRVQSTDRETHDTIAGLASAAQVHAVLGNIWNGRLPGDCRALYAEDAVLHASARPPDHGIDSIEQFYVQLLGALPDAKITVDHTCTESMLPGDFIAVRWTVAGTHTGGNLWGPASGAEVLILGESQYRLVDGRVVEEWLVFDQLAVLTQIERARLAQSPATE